MRTLNYLLLAVANPAKSAELYTKLLGVEPVENSPTFVLYVLPNGVKIGLWIKDEIEPKAKPAGGVEISFTEDSKAAVDATYEAWKRIGAKIVQEPTTMDFGYTFVAEDLDGHRLRPFVLGDNPR
jgi:catechol 2,3-dioxygenase-like lactoylglutathione lyase family enzyme